MIANLTDTRSPQCLEGSGIAIEKLRVAGVSASPAVARAFVRRILREAGCPVHDDAELCTSELVTNAVEHSWSSGPSGTITVCVSAWPGGARIEVRDAGPRPGELAAIAGVEPSPDGESGRGLWLVSQTADTFGFGPGLAWCQFFWPPEASVPAPRRQHDLEDLGAALVERH